VQVGFFQWLRRSFVTGFFVTVPLIISLLALVWAFRVIDDLTGPFFARLIGQTVPGLGLLTTAAFVLLVGVVAGNVLGKRLVLGVERSLLRVPVFRTIYSPVKQLLDAFSPNNEGGFKRVVIARDASGAFLLGFLTKEFELDLGAGRRPFVVVYVPTNNLYLGDVRVFSRDAVFFPALSVEDGVRIVLTGGMAMADRVKALADARGRIEAEGER
jgi:uncharacterized membrane protein